MHRKQLELINLELVQARLARSEAEIELTGRDELIDAIFGALEKTTTPEQAQHITSMLADYRRLRDAEFSFRPVDGEFVDLVHAAVDAARRAAGTRRLLVFTPPSVPATFDATRTRQMLGYLFDDVIAGTAEGSRIEIHLSQPTPQVAELRLRAFAAVPEYEPGVGAQVARALAQRQKGTLSLGLTTSGGLDAVLTLPGRPHSARRKPGRNRARRERVSPVP
jgi:signal transduction histidine kinase